MISADYSFNNNYFVEESYGPGDILKGWVEMSFTNEPSNSTFEYSVGGEGTTITLLNFLNETLGFIPPCNPLTCFSNYDAGEETTSFTFEEARQSVLLGFKLSGSSLSDIPGFLIEFTSDAEESDFSQLSIDVLNNEKNVWQAHAVSEVLRVQPSGCYSSGNEERYITETKYCQTITISPTPKIEIGAVLIGTGTATFEMSIESVDTDDDSYGKCEIEITSGGDIKCVAKIPPISDESIDIVINKEQDYFVCIKATSGDALKYEINTETNHPICGFVGTFDYAYSRDFEIFVKPRKYGAVGDVILNNTEISGIESEIRTYLFITYGENCPSNGCVIPVKIDSMVTQNIDISNVVLFYTDNDETTAKAENLYLLTETPARISTDLQNLSIEAGGFVVPSEYEDYTISLKFNEDTIFSKGITVEKIPRIVSVDPRTTASSYSTDFTVTVESDKQIRLYEWDFGDGDKDTTTTNTVKHTYDIKTNYTLEVKVVDIDNRSSTNSFTITVGSASKVTGPLLEKNKINLETIKNQINNFSVFEQEVLEDALDISTIETNLNLVEIANTNADTEEDYRAILQDLMSMNLPQMIFLGSTANSIIFYPEKPNINIDVLTDIAGGSYESSKEDKYINAVLGWNVKNIDITLTHREIISSFENYNEPLLNIFEVEITKKAGSEDDPYIILRQVEGLTFAADYSKQEKSGYVYFPLVEESKKIVFATTEDINFIDLPLFVSPEISKLSLIDFNLSPLDESGNLKKWILFTLIMLLLIIVGVIFWVVLHAWYKKKYENHLFKNKNNLYNLFTWIGNAKKRGLSEGQLKTQLRKAGWNSEQLRYALRKYSGKKTGMPGISFSKIKKKSQEKKTTSLGKFPQKLQKKLGQPKFQQQTGKKRFRNL